MFMDKNKILKLLIKESIGQSVVNDAILNHKQIKIFYDGDDNIAKGERIIEPYVLGRSKANNRVIRAFQPYGDTQTSVPNWKMFLLDKIRSWRVTGKQFNLPPDKRGFNVAPYNTNGDESMISIRTQAQFKDYFTPTKDNTNKEKEALKSPKNDFISPLDNVRQNKPKPNIIKGAKPNENPSIEVDNNTNNSNDTNTSNNDNLSIGPLTDTNNSVLNDPQIKDIMNQYNLDNNDYSNLNISKDQLAKNLQDYNLKKNRRINNLNRKQFNKQ